MAKFQSPLLGYNNNVRHKNRVFHIQTEDSGVNHPHIITHLFMDGGRILKSVKKSYAEHVGQDGMQEIVRGLMKDQHKAIFVALREGQFDAIAFGAPAAAPAKPAAAPPAPAASPTPAAAKGDVPASDPVIVPSPPSAPELETAASTSEEAKAGRDAPDEAKTVAVEAVKAELPAADATVAMAPLRESSADLVAAEAAEDDDALPTQQLTPMSAAQADVALAARAPSVPDVDETQPFSVLAAQSAEGLAAGPPSSRLAPGAVIKRMPTTTSSSPPATIRQDALDHAAPESAAAAPEVPPATTRQAPLSARELTLDFDALEQAGHDGASGAPSIFNSADLPPPPKNLFAKEPGTGAYRAVEANPAHGSAGESRPPRSERGATERRVDGRTDPREEPASAKESKPESSRSGRVPAGRPATEGRYAPARPAAIFGATRRPPPASLFNDDLVSDKSLDEVILSYLAEDLEPPRRK